MDIKFDEDSDAYIDADGFIRLKGLKKKVVEPSKVTERERLDIVAETLTSIFSGDDAVNDKKSKKSGLSLD